MSLRPLTDSNSKIALRALHCTCSNSQSNRLHRQKRLYTDHEPVDLSNMLFVEDRCGCAQQVQQELREEIIVRYLVKTEVTIVQDTYQVTPDGQSTEKSFRVDTKHINEMSPVKRLPPSATRAFTDD